MLYDDPDKKTGLKKSISLINKTINSLLQKKLFNMPLDKKNLEVADEYL